MPVDIAYTVMEKASIYNLDRGVKHIKFYWHGGEPTLNGIQFFEKIIKFQFELRDKYDIEIKNAIQTNGFLINNEWIEFFKKNSFGVGISIDGPNHINDIQRVSVSNMPTTRIVLNNIKAIMDAGLEAGILSVITNRHQNALTMYEFYRKNKINDVGFCKSFSKNHNILNEEQTVTNSNYSNFMINFFDLFYYGTYQFTHREFEAIMRKIIEAQGNSVCTFSGRTSCGMFPTVNIDGDVFFCDDYDLIIDKVLGNIKNSNFDEIFDSDLFKKRKQESLEVYYDCAKRCDFAAICGAGCPRHDLRTANNKIENYYCESSKLIIQHTKEIVEKTISHIK